MKLFKARSISTKLSILVAVIPLLTGSLLFFTLTRIKNLERVALANVEQIMLNGHMIKVQALATSMATALGETLVDVKGRDNREAYVRRIVNPIRFFQNKTGYFFVYRRDGTQIALPTAPHLVGINSFSESPRSQKQVADFIEKAEKGGGFTQWYWEKPGKQGTYLKQGYVAPIPGTDLLLITAVYIDDVKEEKAAAAATFEQFFKKTSRQSIAVVVVVFLIVLLPFLYFLRSRVINPIKALVSASRALADGDYTIDLSYRAPDEIGELTRAFSQMARKRKEAEEEIMERRKFLESVLSDAPDAIIVLDAKHRVLEWNPGAEKLFAYRSQEAIGKNLDDLVSRDAAHAEATAFTKKVLAGETLHPVETVRYRKDGSKVNVIACGSPIYMGGQLIGVVAVYTNISELKQKAAALYESEQRLEMALKSADLGLWDWHVQTGEAVYNERWAQMLGYSLDEIKSEHHAWESRIHPDDRQRVMAELKAHLEGKCPFYSAEHRLLSKSGQWKWVHSIGKTVTRAPDGTPLRAVGIHMDITERKQTEEEVHRLRHLLDSIINTVPDIVYRLDPQGRITFISQTVTKYGYSTNELIGKSILDIVHPEDRQSVRSRIDEKRTGNRRTRDLEIRLLTRSSDGPVSAADSEHRTFLLEAEGLYESENQQAECFIGTQGIARDITERKKLESQLQQAQKMEAIGTLAGGIAHDFNNILGSIIGYAELIEMLDVPEDSNIRDRLKRILSSAYRAKDLVQQILTFSRRSEQNTAPVALTLIVKEAIKFLRASLPATIKIDVRVDTGNSTVLGDATQLYQVLMNLCTNAAHAMGEKGGLLEVSLRDVDYDSMDSGLKADLEPGPYIMLCVQDTGCGIPTDVVKCIFDPFYTTKRPGEGTGLGLSVVHGIVKSMHGAVSVHTQIGQGSLFRVYLPRQKEKQQKPVSEKIHRIMGGQGCIMFIDDEAALVDFARQILTKLGYEVVAHTSSTQALEQFTQQPEAFDLVVTDLAMPDLPGLQLAESIMRLRPALPIILCSGFMDPEKVKKARDMGIKEFIMKPFGVREFAQTIRRVLNG